MRSLIVPGHRSLTALVFITVAVALSGCGSLTRAARSESALLTASAGLPPASTVPAAPVMPQEVEGTAPAPVVGLGVAPVAGVVTEAPAHEASAPDLVTASVEPAEGSPPTIPIFLVQAPQTDRPAPPADNAEEEYDPWEPFNEAMFEFNRRLDRYVLKPVAKGYNVVMPSEFQVLVANGFDNISFVPRLINSMLQGKWGGAGRELSRFLINSTAGIGGLFDPAKDYWGIQKSREDFGQTLGVWGSGPGPYLVLPLLEPLTVRDGIGKLVDSFMDPLSYFLPFFWDRLGMKIGDTVNDRALNLDLYQGFEESVIDMYSAVRHGYLRRREQLIKE